MDDAAILPDGSIAGLDLGGDLWRFNPDSSAWAGPYPGRMSRQFASLAVDVAGRVLVIGGHAAGAGASDPGAFFGLPLVDRFDPTTGAWTAMAATPDEVSLGSAHVVDGRLYVVGDSAGQSPELVVLRFTEADVR
jgi:hypothetical protein